MAEQTVSWKSLGGSLHDTKELAMRHDVEKLLEPFTNDLEACLGPVALSERIVSKREEFLAALQWKEDPKLPKPRKPRKDKGVSKTAPVPLPLDAYESRLK